MADLDCWASKLIGIKMEKEHLRTSKKRVPG
jgi:hypothetical protein